MGAGQHTYFGGRNMYCSNCGNILPDGAKFCPKCGRATGRPAADTVPGGLYTLTIMRENQWFAVNPAVRMTLDGSQTYSIGNGDTLRIPVSSGAHCAAFSCSIRNKVVNLNVAGDITLRIRWNRVTGSLEVE